MRGLLVRQRPVRLLDFSVEGCCLESRREIAPGTTWDLRVDLGGKAYSDTVHVVRCDKRQGPRLLHLGGQFSWGTRPGAASVRGVVALLGHSGAGVRQGDLSGSPLVCTGTSEHPYSQE